MSQEMLRQLARVLDEKVTVTSGRMEDLLYALVFFMLPNYVTPYSEEQRRACIANLSVFVKQYEQEHFAQQDANTTA